MRLGSYSCDLEKGSKAFAAYRKKKYLKDTVTAGNSTIDIEIG